MVRRKRRTRPEDGAVTAVAGAVEADADDARRAGRITAVFGEEGGDVSLVVAGQAESGLEFTADCQHRWATGRETDGQRRMSAGAAER